MNTIKKRTGVDRHMKQRKERNCTVVKEREAEAGPEA